jgi:hypothetical protein
MSDINTSATTEVTENSATENTQAVKTFTQEEVNAILAKTKSQLEKKFSTKYEDLGDPDELRDIVSNYRKSQQEQQLKRGEFDKVIQDLAAKKDAEIQKLARQVETYKVETPILDAAARFRAVNPEQVKALIRNQVRLNADGEVEVIDTKGTVQYDDSGKPLSVETYVKTWLQQNPHFVSASPSTTNGASSINNASHGPVDLNKLDMKNPEHRKIYAAARKAR